MPTLPKLLSLKPAALPSVPSDSVCATRRRVLQSLLATSLLPPLSVLAASPVPRSLILIELAGGNDGLNMVVPFAQSNYYSARPNIAIAKDQLVRLDERLGLHPHLEPLLPSWKNGDLHVALGVGYPDPNRSHFRSSDIWHTASGSDKVIKHGWLANAFDPGRRDAFSAEGIAFGSDYGPLRGSSQSLVLENPLKFARQARNMRPAEPQPHNVALNHIVDTRRQIARAHADLNDIIEAHEKRKLKGSALNKQLSIISALIAADARVPVFKATHKGYDTHFYQPNRHNNLMKELGEALGGLRQRLVDSGHWNDTLIMTYSEFGRRAAENGSRGTDHGTAAPVLLMGGAVQGGYSGQQPEFPKNREQDLSFNLDYRHIYRTLSTRWLDAPAAANRLSGFQTLDFLRA